MENKKVNIEKLPEAKLQKYFAKSSILFSMLTQKKIEETAQLFDGQGGMRMKLTLESLDGSESHECDVMEIFEMEWENDDE